MGNWQRSVLKPAFVIPIPLFYVFEESELELRTQFALSNFEEEDGKKVSVLPASIQPSWLELEAGTDRTAEAAAGVSRS